jgi:hypothetical protein
LRIFGKIILGLVFIVSIFIAWINFKLYSENFTKTEKPQDIILQLNFLERELKNNNLGERMQDIFPEGFVFTNALYGLSYIIIVKKGDTLLLKSKDEMKRAFIKEENSLHFNLVVK